MTPTHVLVYWTTIATFEVSARLVKSSDIASAATSSELTTIAATGVSRVSERC